MFGTLVKAPPGDARKTRLQRMSLLVLSSGLAPVVAVRSSPPGPQTIGVASLFGGA